jgi:tRNA(Arg) A34 adenosine deaminase TadA
VSGLVEVGCLDELSSAGHSGAMPAAELPLVLRIALPDWVPAVVADHHATASPEDRMRLVLDLARSNIADGGGPFAAAIFRADTAELVSVGLNRVVASHAAIAHAEVVAIALAGQRLGRFDLAAAGPIELVTSCEPCAMCLGAVPWAGVTRVLAGARDEDARAVGFDEGDKPTDWATDLRARGIEVVIDVLREPAAAVLRAYVDGGGHVYNGDHHA